MKVELTKKYRTRDGRKAVIHTTSGPRKNYPVVASVEDFSAEGGWKSASFTEDGKIYFDRPDSQLDLIEVREPLECWVRVENGHVDVLQEPETYKVTHEYRRFREVID